jgi:hypothetical protein
MKSPVRKHKGPKPKPANDNSSLRDRLHAARIGWRETLLGAIGWGAAMALSAQASLWLSNAALTSHYWSLTALAFAGGALAWPFSLSTFRFIAYGRGREPAFAAAVLCLVVFTIGVTAVMFSILYRNFYAQWHGDPFTRTVAGSNSPSRPPQRSTSSRLWACGSICLSASRFCLPPPHTCWPAAIAHKNRQKRPS